MVDTAVQAEVIAFLSDPKAYGASSPVQRIDTHAAIVFLCGDKAYKVKRAVRLPYLDFSTVEKRKAVCEAELALNRRTAPDLYLSVAPVGRTADGTLALGAGDAVEWVVEMRRFASDRLLSAMADAGTLALPLMRDLADGIAAFHNDAKVVPGPGAPRAHSVIDGNRASMAALESGLLASDVCDRLHRESLSALDDLAALLNRRGERGCVRHCHGDLHLANICLWEGRPTLFDCLEFDPDLATTDVLYDIAFLVMDLWQRGLHAHASLVFNRYCDMRGESEGLAAMPLFLSMRAAVRAHVEASAATRQADAEKRAEKRAAGRHYLDAALAFLAPRQPRLIAVGGLSGTGKSTLAGAIAPRVGAAPGARWLRSDVLRKRMAGLPPEQSLPADTYTRQNSVEVYHRLMVEARQVLEAGIDVIVDAVFANPQERLALSQLAASAGARFDGIWLAAAPDILRRRVQRRVGDASDANVSVVDRQLGYDVGDLTGWHRINADNDAEAVLTSALRGIGLHCLP